jgi:hypothetical protein
MSAVEVPTPILNVPFHEPKLYWYIREGEEPQLREGRRKSIVYPPQNQKHEWDTSDGTLQKCSDPPSALRNRTRQFDPGKGQGVEKARVSWRFKNHSRTAGILAAGWPSGSIVLCPTGSLRILRKTISDSLLKAITVLR